MILHIRRCKVGVPGKSPMSAYGYKQTYRGQLANVRFTPNSGHSNHDSGSGTCQCPLCPFRNANINQDFGDFAHLGQQAPARPPGNRQCGEVLVALDGGSRLLVQHAVNWAWIEPDELDRDGLMAGKMWS